PANLGTMGSHREGLAVNLQITINVSIHAKVLGGHGAGGGGQAVGKGRVVQDVEEAVGQGGGIDGGEPAGAGLAEDRLVVGEIGGDDRSAGGEIDGDLALHRIVLAASQSGMDQHIGPSR